MRGFAIALAPILFVAVVAFGPLAQLAQKAGPDPVATTGASAVAASTPSRAPSTGFPAFGWKTYFTSGGALAAPAYWRLVPAPAPRWVYGNQLQMSLGVGDDQGDVPVCLPDACHRTHGPTLQSLRRALMRLLTAEGLTDQRFMDVAMGGAKASAICGAQAPHLRRLMRAQWCLVFDIRGGRPAVVAMRHYVPTGRTTKDSVFPSEMQRHILAGLHVAEHR